MRVHARRRPVISFFALVFAISWAMGAVQLVLPVDTTAGAVISALPLRLRLLSPAVAALVMAGVVGGRAGLRELYQRSTKWRVGLRWYVIVLVVFPVLFGLGIGVGILLTGGASLPEEPLGWGMWLALPLLVFLGGPLHEELGWRGFALPRMLDRFGDLHASVLLGVLWAAWHWQPWELPGGNFGFLEVFLPNQIAAVALAVLMTWVYRHTGGSALLAGFGMHLSANLVLGIVSTSIVVPRPLGVTWGQAVGLVLLAVAVVAAYGTRRFTRQSTERSPAVDV